MARDLAAIHADAPLLALCAKLREMQAEWQRRWAATPDAGGDTPEDRALKEYHDWTWPGVRVSASERGERDLVRQLLTHRATTPEGRQAKAAVVLATEDAALYCDGDGRDDSLCLVLDVLREAAGDARSPLGDAALAAPAAVETCRRREVPSTLRAHASTAAAPSGDQAARPAPVSLASPWAKHANGTYRATLSDGRGVWVWSPAPGEWRYGLLSGCEDVPNTYGAPRLHLAKADCLALAG